METIAIYHENTIIYWNSIIIVAGIIAGFTLGLALYKGTTKYSFQCYMYLAIATISSLYFSKIMHWYCHIEQYESFNDAITNLSGPGYLIPGMLIALWLSALFLCPILKNRSRYTILDPFAPAFAFIIAIIKFSDIFSDTCLGKVCTQNPFFQRLPFSKAVTDSSGNTEYRFATFFITFLLMLVVTVILIVIYTKSISCTYKTPVKKTGHTFRFFLVLYGGIEVVMDSTRYDASHLYFPGEKLAGLNKGAGFMGLSQFFGAIFLIYCFIYYFVYSVKANGKTKKHILPWILFITGLALGAGCEYLVQRFTSQYLIWYMLQSLGVIVMIVSIFLLYKTCIEDNNKKEVMED